MGVGKTGLAAQFPKVLIMGFECGTNALNNVYVQPIKKWEDWKQVVSQLIRKPELKEKFETIAIDTADSAWDLCVKYVCGQNGVDKINEIPWGGGYDQAKKEYQGLFRDLTFAGYGVIFISHSTEKTLKDDKGEEYQQIAPALPQRPYDIINKMVDVIGYIREIEVSEGVSKRFIFFRGDKRFFAKSRFKYIQPRVEFTYENIVDAIYEAIDKEVATTGGEATNDVNPYTIKSYDDMITEAKEFWIKATEANRKDEVLKVLEEVIGRPIRFSEITAEYTQELEKILLRLKDMF